MMLKNVPLKVKDGGPPTITLTDKKHDYQYQQISPSHTCKSPRSLQTGDTVLLVNDPGPSKSIVVRLVLNACGECTFFLYDYVGDQA